MKKVLKEIARFLVIYIVAMASLYILGTWWGYKQDFARGDFNGTFKEYFNQDIKEWKVWYKQVWK